MMCSRLATLDRDGPFVLHLYLLVNSQGFSHCYRESRLLVTDSMTVSLALGMGLVAEALPPSAVARHSGARTSPYRQRAIHIGPTVEAELS